jgi:hypothetical protein
MSSKPVVTAVTFRYQVVTRVFVFTGTVMRRSWMISIREIGGIQIGSRR